jgi:ubiquinone/menaquinone biosynthesis C-methylase UbiE
MPAEDFETGKDQGSMPGRLSDLLWGPVFARGFDRFNKGAEDAGLREKRRALLARARGRTLELGAGTGVNIGLYPDSLTELVLTEPDGHMRHQLEHKLAALGRPAEVVDATADRLPFPDASIDSAVATLVFCTVPDPGTALSEIERVLKPGGSLLFLEHVRADKPGAARWQDRLERPWGWFGRGCHPNRDTLATLKRSGLELVEVEHGRIAKVPRVVRPLIVGEARRPQRGRTNQRA